MIAELNELWEKWTQNRPQSQVKDMVVKHSDAFTVLNFVNKGLVTPTEAAYVLLRAMKEDING